jgi:hypothetical protein
MTHDTSHYNCQCELSRTYTNIIRSQLLLKLALLNVYQCVSVCKFTLDMRPLYLAQQPKQWSVRAAQSKGVGGDSLSGRRDALHKIYCHIMQQLGGHESASVHVWAEPK